MSETTFQQLFIYSFSLQIWKAFVHSPVLYALCKRKEHLFLSHPECFPSLLQDGEFPRLKEGLNHPHGEDVHFGIHHNLFFLHEIYQIKA